MTHVFTTAAAAAAAASAVFEQRRCVCAERAANETGTQCKWAYVHGGSSQPTHDRRAPRGGAGEGGGEGGEGGGEGGGE